MTKNRRFSPVAIWAALSLTAGAIAQVSYSLLTQPPKPVVKAVPLDDPLSGAAPVAGIEKTVAPYAAAGTAPASAGVQWVLPDANSNTVTSPGSLLAVSAPVSRRSTIPKPTKTSGPGKSSASVLPRPVYHDPDPTLNSAYTTERP